MAVQPEVSGGTSHFHHAVQLLTRRSGRAAKLAQALIVGAAVHELGNKLLSKGRDATQYSVRVHGEDDVYDDVQAWLVANLPPKRRRALTARTKRRSSNGHDAIAHEMPGNGKRPVETPALRLFYDGTKTQTVIIDGHRVKCDVERNDSAMNGKLSEEQMANYFAARESIVFRCTGTTARDAVLVLIESIAQARIERTTSRFYMARWSSWNRRNDLPRRRLDTVILKAGQREAIMGDLREFLRAEQSYARIGLPWHRGYVFHGPPGTGKTSLARALAEHFELDLYFMPLSDLENDASLLQLFSAVDPRSMLVLEDVDIAHAARERDDDQPKSITMSGLLNALDGLATPHGLVTVMTTNDISVLDSALLRPGRADRIEELGYLDHDQLARLSSLIVGHNVRMPSTNPLGHQPLGDLTHAAVIEAVKPYLDASLEMQLAAIAELLNERRARSNA